MKKRISTKTVAVLGVLLSAALILGYVESLIPFDFAIPGIKLGLPNIITLLLLRKKGIAYALPFAIARAALTNLLFGDASALLYALAGGIVSVAAMYCIGKIKVFGVCGQSIAGAVGHNIGQLCTAALLTATPALIIYYLPFLMVSAAVSGFLIGAGVGILEKKLVNAI